jgi:hypothetical protein
MARIFGLVLAGGMVLGAASESKAQFGLSVGNPYYGGYGMGMGGYGYGYPGFAYSSGYAGVAPMMGGYGMPGYGGFNRGYAYRPIYRSYGYGLGMRRGFGPFRRWRRW